MRFRHKKKRSWRRIVANLLILGGLAVIAYPAGTWAYTWWKQSGLRTQLEQMSPSLKGQGQQYFGENMTRVALEQADQREQARLREHLKRLEALRAAAGAFKQSVGNRGGTPLGKILIPRIDVDVVILEGTGKSDLREGPGHWPETPMPGEGGNFVVSGHRTTYGAPFFKLDKLAPGDEIKVLMPYLAARYRVTDKLIVKPDQVDVVAQRGKEEISLATCHPIYSARQRLVIKGELVEFSIIESAPKSPAESSKDREIQRPG